MGAGLGTPWSLPWRGGGAVLWDYVRNDRNPGIHACLLHGPQQLEQPSPHTKLDIPGRRLNYRDSLGSIANFSQQVAGPWITL